MGQLTTQNLNKGALKVFQGDIEIDESYFGEVRKGKRGRGAAGKTIVFDMLKRRQGLYRNRREHKKIDTNE
jgi:transposase